MNKKLRFSSLALACCVSSSFATGFQLWEQDAAGIGDYHAGAAVDTGNTGIEFYNPGGMVFMKRKGPQISTGFAYIPLNVAFKGETNQDGGYIQKTQGWVDGSTHNIVPNLHAIYPLAPHWALGFGITTPFGLATKYPEINPLAQAATRTQLKTININPSLAYQVNSWLGIGAGIDAQYATADFDQAAPIISNLNIRRDTNHLTSLAWGWNVGAYIKASKNIQLGASYRSKIIHRAEGTGTAQDADLIPGKHTTSTSSITASLPLPATLYLSARDQITPKFSILASGMRTWWSCLQSLTIQGMPNPLHNIIFQPSTFDLVTPFGYRDTWNVALGAHYWVNKHWMIKIGGGYDWTPTNDKYRDIRLPDANRWALAVGTRVLATSRITWDAGWTHLMPIHNARINNNGPQGLPSFGGDTTISTIGEAKTSANVIGMQLTMYFK